MSKWTTEYEAQYKRQWYIRNRERILARQRQVRRPGGYWKEYYARNRDKIKGRVREWELANPERAKENHRKAQAAYRRRELPKHLCCLCLKPCGNFGSTICQTCRRMALSVSSKGKLLLADIKNPSTAIGSYLRKPEVQRSYQWVKQTNKKLMQTKKQLRGKAEFLARAV